MPTMDINWSDFVGRIWSRQPVVIKKCLPEIVATSDFLDILIAYKARVLSVALNGQEGRAFERGDARMYVDGRSALPNERRSFLEAVEVGSATEFVRRVSALLGGKKIGLLLSDIEIYKGSLAARLQSFVSDMIVRVGIPAGDVESTLFVGNYSETPFGIHNDLDCDVITICIEGRKRMLVWPPEYFEVEGGRRNRLRQEVPNPISEFGSDAIVLEAEPGDLMYWPRNWYHVAQGTGEAVATVGIGFHHRLSLSAYITWIAYQLLGDELGSGESVVEAFPAESTLPDSLGGAAGKLEHLVASGRLRSAVQESWERRVRASGFTSG